MKKKILKNRKSIGEKISELLIKIKEARTFKKYPIVWDSKMEVPRKK